MGSRAAAAAARSSTMSAAEIGNRQDDVDILEHSEGQAAPLPSSAEEDVELGRQDAPQHNPQGTRRGAATTEAARPPAEAARARVTIVKGAVGKERWEIFLLHAPRLFLLAVALPMIVTSLFSLPALYAWSAVIWLLVAIVTFNLLAPGPLRCWDISCPVRFELTNYSLTVLSRGSGPCGLRQKTETWSITEVEAVGVYVQAESCSVCPRRRAAAVEPPRQGAPQLALNRDEVRDQLPSWASPLQRLSGAKADFRCAFLGAKLSGAAGVVPLSRRVWHRGGVSELYDLCEKVQSFQRGELLGDAPARRASGKTKRVGASEETIAALPKLCYHRTAKAGGVGEEEAAEEVDECAICLECMQDGDVVNLLPCRHVFHCGCAEEWLRISGSCPTCKEAVGKGSSVGEFTDGNAHVAVGVLLSPVV